MTPRFLSLLKFYWRKRKGWGQRRQADNNNRTQHFGKVINVWLQKIEFDVFERKPGTVDLTD